MLSSIVKRALPFYAPSTDRLAATTLSKEKASEATAYTPDYKSMIKQKPEFYIFDKFDLMEIRQNPKSTSVQSEESEPVKEAALIVHGLIRLTKNRMFSTDAWRSVLEQAATLPHNVEPYLVKYRAELLLPLSVKDIQTLRTSFKKMLIDLSTKSPLSGKSIHIFAHSMGSLICLGALHDLSTEELEQLNLETVMAVASPLKGSSKAKMAHLITRNVQTRDLRINSKYLRGFSAEVKSSPDTLQKLDLTLAVAGIDESIPSGSIQEFDEETNLGANIRKFDGMEHTAVIKPAFKVFAQSINKTHKATAESADPASLS